jgi:hypothetical protein
MNDLLEKLDPAKQPDPVRQAALEKLAYGGKVDPALWPVILSVYPKEPTQWIRQLEIKVLKRLPFNAEVLPTLTELLASPNVDIRQEIATLLRDQLIRLATEKKAEERKKLEAAILPHLGRRLAPGGEPSHAVRALLYTILSNANPDPQVTEVLIRALALGEEEAYLTFAQYVQKKYPPEALKPLTEIFSKTHGDEPLVHILRAFQLSLSKEGTLSGYPNSEEIVRTLMSGLTHGSENVRKEAAAIIATRAQVARKQKQPLPLEEEVWTGCFTLYGIRLSAIAALDRDQAKLALKFIPATPDRLTRLFALLDRTHDELQKQNVLDLVAVHKIPETRNQLLKMIREGFGKLRLEAQKTTIDAAAGFIPDAEVEAELEHLLEGKGLHSDIQIRLADKLFIEIPSLKERLLRWLRIDEKTKRPALDRFDLPAMHVKVIEAAKKLPADQEVRAKLKELETLEIFADAKIKISETLRDFEEASPFQKPPEPASQPAARPPSPPKAPEPQILAADQVAAALLPIIDPLPKARIVFQGFALPETFGGTQEFAFGDAAQKQEMGKVSPMIGEVAKNFVKKAIQDIFSGSLGEISPKVSRFRLTREADVITIAAEK